MSAEESAAAVAKPAPAEGAIDPAIVELTDQIASLGTSIADAKKAKQPKEEWDPFLQKMLALKIQYKEKTGKDYHAPGKAQESKKPKGENNQAASDKNAAKRAKKAAEKAAKEEKKRKQREERERREREKLEKLKGAANEDWSGVFGDAPMIQSKFKSEEGIGRWTKIGNLDESMKGKEVLVRGFLHTSRGVGKGAFVLLRSSLYTVQCVAFESKGGDGKAEIPSAMIKYMTGLPVESIVDVYGTVTVPENPVEGATQSAVEIQASKFHCVNKAKAAMPFQMEDACRPDAVKETDVGAYDHDANSSAEGGRGDEARPPLDRSAHPRQPIHLPHPIRGVHVLSRIPTVAGLHRDPHAEASVRCERGRRRRLHPRLLRQAGVFEHESPAA